MAATVNYYPTISSGALSTVSSTQAVAGTSLACDVSSYGDGLYIVEFEGVVAGACAMLWRFNGGAMVTPKIVYEQVGPNAPLSGVLSTAASSNALAANFITTVDAATTVAWHGWFSSRNGVISPISVPVGYGADSNQNVSVRASGYHTPNATLTSIGLAGSSDQTTIDTNINAGSVLRVFKVG